MFSKHPEWPTVNFILKTLHERGHQAVLAGGCVRDALLGREAKDLDVATNATPEQVESYFKRVLPLGKSFGVCRVIHDGSSIEVATFRQEFDYKDGRRPHRVEYSSLEQDAKRRDFTINALFYDVEADEVIDLVGGVEDLNRRQLRCVGEPERRFGEDYLRLLRGIRFAGQLDFQIEAETYRALKKLAPLLARISRERIYDELNKMLVRNGVYRCYQLLVEMKIFDVIFEDWNSTTCISMNNQSIDAVQLFQSLSFANPENSIYGWTVLYQMRRQDRDVKSVEKEFMALKMPRSQLEMCKKIVESSALVSTQADEQIRVFIEICVAQVLEVSKKYWVFADESGVWLSECLRCEQLYFVEGKLPEPLVTGHDLISYNVSPGPEMKRKLQASYIMQLKNKKWNKEEIISEIIHS